ncbi:MAG: cation-translocating P-type ATPase [Pseudomonadota bacterium]|nr:cation-translocating P-type ATPase [Pseudomonadota bacterium]
MSQLKALGKTLRNNSSQDEKISLKVLGMDCGACAMTIESGIRKLNGVKDVKVSFTTETMEILGKVDIELIEKTIRKLGYKLTKEKTNNFDDLKNYKGLRGFFAFIWGQPIYRRAILVSLLTLLSITVDSQLSIPQIFSFPFLTLVFSTAVIIAGTPIFLKGFRSLFFAGQITIDLLMAVAAIGALGIGATGEAITVILLFILGEALEAFSAEKARDSLRSLLSLQPQDATVLETHSENHEGDAHKQNNRNHSHEVIKAVEKVNTGDRILVKPGQRIPVDGEIINGTSSINQAPVTGEEIPVLKAVGDEVMAGTVNGEAALEILVTRPSSEGTIARIAKLVQQAQAQRSPAERFIDRFARYYTPTIVVIAIGVVAIPVFLLGKPFLNDPDGGHGWLYRGLTLLIIACPCALIISIPVTVVSGLTRLAQLGVLVKSGALLDRLADIMIVAFDKTGTLTEGKPIVTGIRSINCVHPLNKHQDCLHCDEVMKYAATLERASEHPIAYAIVSEAAQRKGVNHIQIAEKIHAYPGKGIGGEINNKTALVGKKDLFKGNELGWNKIINEAKQTERSGQTVMYVSVEDKVLGFIGTQDAIRNNSSNALAELKEMTPPISNIMLTGDNIQTAQRVTNLIPEIDKIKAGLLPAEKLEEIEKLYNQDILTAMVGDGINDAPALARADIGIAMGGNGTAQAMEIADVVLMQDNLSHVAMALRMARKCRAIIKQNIFLSLLLKIAFLILTVPGITTLWMAVLADVGATLIVTINGMRLLRQT